MNVEVLRYKIRVIPQSSRERTVVLSNGVLKVTLREPAVSGKANEALLRTLAHYYKVSIRDVLIVHGQTSNNKIIEIKRER